MSIISEIGTFLVISFDQIRFIALRWVRRDLTYLTHATQRFPNTGMISTDSWDY